VSVRIKARDIMCSIYSSGKLRNYGLNISITLTPDSGFCIGIRAYKAGIRKINDVKFHRVAAILARDNFEAMAFAGSSGEDLYICFYTILQLMDHLHYRLNFDLDKNFITA
jgi:hypothetical protein